MLSKVFATFRRQGIVFLSFGALIIITLFCAWQANYTASGNSDDLIYPYLFHHPSRNDIILPGQHSNILKFPLFLFQALVPYNFTTFTIVDIGLVLLTIIGWTTLLVVLLGKRYAALLTAVLGLILLGSPTLTYEISGTTIRNIEYPIALLFIVCCGFILKTQTLRLKHKLLVALAAAAYALVCAGDSFFIYTVTFSLLIVMLFSFITEGGGARNYRVYKRAFAYLVATTLAAFVVRLFIKKLGIVLFYTAPMFVPHILPLNHLAPSILTALTQLLNLSGANIFGQSLRFSNSLVFVNFLFLVLGLVGLCLLIRRHFVPVNHDKKLESNGSVRHFALIAMSVTFFVTLAVYILSDLAVRNDDSGHIISAGQDRYLTLLPLIAVAGLGYTSLKYAAVHKWFGGAALVTLFALILINSSYIKHQQLPVQTFRNGAISVARVSEANGVQLLLSGYWYGASSRFWSQNQLSFATVAACNAPQPEYNNRLSWYRPSTVIHRSALVVSHSGPDAPYWECSDSQLLAIYGEPVKRIDVRAVGAPSLWIYDYDLRSRVGPMQIQE